MNRFCPRCHHYFNPGEAPVECPACGLRLDPPFQAGKWALLEACEVQGQDPVPMEVAVDRVIESHDPDDWWRDEL